MACWLVFLAALFDVFDGLAARAMGGGTPLGAQLDSLADMVSFGAAPGMITWMSFTLAEVPSPWPGGACLVMATASAWRLAKFNIDDRQSHGFLGLATPANGLFWASIPIVLSGVASPLGFTPPAADLLRTTLLGFFTTWPPMVFVVALLLAILMLVDLPLPGLKFKRKGWRGNEVIFILIASGAVLVGLYGMLAVPLLLVLYVLSPLWGRLFPQEP